MSIFDDESVEKPQASDKYLKIPDPIEGEKATKIKIRILESRPVKVFKHWIGPDQKSVRPYNCPGKLAGCLACAERQHAKDAQAFSGKDYRGPDPRDIHRMNKRYLFNVLVLGPDPKVKIFSFGQDLGGKIDFLHSEHGDLRDFNIMIVKRRTGPLAWDVNYDAIYDDAPDRDKEGVLDISKRYKLSDDEKALAEGKYDLEEEIKPAELEVISAAVRGVSGPAPNGNGNGALASTDQIITLTEVAAKHGLKLDSLNVDPKTALAEHVERLISRLSA